MAKAKIGLDYFSVDTDRFQDRRIKRLKKDFGCNGFAVYEYILNEIYRVRGCFLEWDEDTAFDVAEYWGLKENTVKEIVKYCGAVGLFDKELLSRGIVTSSSIQDRYLLMCSRAKRLNPVIPSFCKITPEQSDIITEESEIPPEELTQSKVKESILKEKSSTDVEDKKKSTLPPASFEGMEISIEDEFRLLSSEEIWKESIIKNHSLNRSSFDLMLQKFIDFCKCDGKTSHKNLSDAKQHFNRWLMKIQGKPIQNRQERRETLMKETVERLNNAIQNSNNETNQITP